jgi:hypothetical protein
MLYTSSVTCLQARAVLGTSPVINSSHVHVACLNGWGYCVPGTPRYVSYKSAIWTLTPTHVRNFRYITNLFVAARCWDIWFIFIATHNYAWMKASGFKRTTVLHRIIVMRECQSVGIVHRHHNHTPHYVASMCIVRDFHYMTLHTLGIIAELLWACQLLQAYSQRRNMIIPNMNTRCFPGCLMLGFVLWFLNCFCRWVCFVLMYVLFYVYFL